MPGGRPPKAISRGRVVSIRLTQQEFSALERGARAARVSVSEYLRLKALADIEGLAETDVSNSPAWRNRPEPIVEVLQAAAAEVVASNYNGPYGSRLEFWAAGREEVMVVHRPGYPMEAWQLLRGGANALRAQLIPARWGHRTRRPRGSNSNNA